MYLRRDALGRAELVGDGELVGADLPVHDPRWRPKRTRGPVLGPHENPRLPTFEEMDGIAWVEQVLPAKRTSQGKALWDRREVDAMTLAVLALSIPKTLWNQAQNHILTYANSRGIKVNL